MASAVPPEAPFAFLQRRRHLFGQQRTGVVAREGQDTADWCLCCPLLEAQQGAVPADAQRLHLRARGFILLPPVPEPTSLHTQDGPLRDEEGAPASPQWFSGTFLCADSRRVTLLAKEKEIDECLRCVDGGYQHFRLEVHVPAQNLTGLVDVERTGGDLVFLRSPWLTFTAEKSFAGDAAAQLVASCFPSVFSRVQDEPSTLAECVVCSGEVELTGLPAVPGPRSRQQPQQPEPTRVGAQQRSSDGTEGAEVGKKAEHGARRSKAGDHASDQNFRKDGTGPPNSVQALNPERVRLGDSSQGDAAAVHCLSPSPKRKKARLGNRG